MTGVVEKSVGFTILLRIGARLSGLAEAAISDTVNKCIIALLPKVVFLFSEPLLFSNKAHMTDA